MDIVLLHNPNAGDADNSAAELVRLCQDAGFRPHYHDLHAALKTPEVFSEGEFVVVAGGDGSLRKAALALLEHPRPLAPLPLGTANNISHSLGLDGSPEQIIRGWGKGNHRRRFDVGIADGPWGERRFFEGVGIGIVSRTMTVLEMIDEASDRAFDAARDKLHRDLCVFAALAHELAPRKVDLQIDGEVISDEFLLLEVLNIRRAGPGVELAAAADPFDGRFDLSMVRERQRDRLVKAILEQLAGRSASDFVDSRRGRELRLEVEETSIRIDDQTLSIGKRANITVTLQPGALEIVLPR